MIWLRELVKQGTLKVRYVLAATAAGFLANAQPALAAQVQAYVIVDAAAASNASSAGRKVEKHEPRQLLAAHHWKPCKDRGPSHACDGRQLARGSHAT